jgi:AraC-like DNA-binding protein
MYPHFSRSSTNIDASLEKAGSDKSGRIPMDSLITAAARALASGDPLGALKRVALREDAPALALRGIAMAQLGDFSLGKQLLRRAARAFSPKESVARARCIIAEAEIALASRDLGRSPNALTAARVTLEEHGDRLNAAHAHYLEIRRLVLIGRLDQAERLLADLESAVLPPALTAAHKLLVAGIAMRRIRTETARSALAQAEVAARQARIPALIAEVEHARGLLSSPAARLITRGEERHLLLEEVEALLASDAFIVDACRNVVRYAHSVISLVKRPVLFALARSLAQAWPGDVDRGQLLARAFGARSVDESHRMRLRVEIARLRNVLRPLADIRATQHGFTLAPCSAGQVLVLAQPVEDQNGAVLALLSDGEPWSSSALAIALGISQRTVQRALDSLAGAGRVQSIGRARARRWITPPVPGFTTTLLLPTPLPVDE